MISMYTAMTAFGIMFGYILGAITTWIWPHTCPNHIACWRFPFALSYWFITYNYLFLVYTI